MADRAADRHPDAGQPDAPSPGTVGPGTVGPGTAGPDAEDAEGAGPDARTATAPHPAGARQVTLRRAPRYRAFVLTGVVLGVVIAVALAVLFPRSGDFSERAVLGYLAMTLGLLGGLLGGLVAVLVERPRKR